MSRPSRQVVRRLRHARVDPAAENQSVGPDTSVLLDVNVLIALAWPNHIHHVAARAWFDSVGRLGFATCPVTQAGFIRISSNNRAIPDARGPREARELLHRITELAGHSFWSDDIDLARGEHIAWERVGSHAQVTDAHILAIALRHGGHLATFDRGLANLVPEDAAQGTVILIAA